MSEFVKNGERIITKPNGFDYDLVAGKLYDLCWDDFSGMAYLKENGEMNLPSKIYTNEAEDRFINRVIYAFDNSNSNTTGVLLYGDKGTGKSICMKRIAKQSDLPIIVVSNEFPAWQLTPFFKNFSSKVCVLFDELEKNPRRWETSKILGFLDGVESTCKKLVIFTCNEICDINDNLFDRCSRIRYCRAYDYEDNKPLIQEIIKDKNVSLEIEKYIFDHVKVLSIDNVLSIINEIEMFPDIEISEIIKHMNVEEK